MSIVKVTFEWDDECGECYECGLPAAYRLDLDGTKGSTRLCSVCTAEELSYRVDGVSSLRPMPVEDLG